MANGRGNQHSKKNPVTVAGPWLAMPLDFLRSRAWAELPTAAAKMLLDLCAGLGPNAKGNGDLSAAPAVMEPKGWNSTATRVAALNELLKAELIVVTRRGNRRLCTLYAITLWPLQCDLAKLDFGPGAFSTSDWMRVRTDSAQRPTIEAPAKWNVLRKGANSGPATGQPSAGIDPPRDNPAPISGAFVPGTGAKGPISVQYVVPPRDTFLDLPSGAVVQPAECCV